MGLLELCLLSVLLPQDPAPAPSSEQDPAARLAALALDSDSADAEELLRLCVGDDPAVARRACWLLARSNRPEHVSALTEVLRRSTDADVRLHAMQGLRRRATPDVRSAVVAALEDDDRRVRTLAVQTLARLAAAGVPPADVVPELLALVDRRVEDAASGPATDVQAAVLTLSDLNATEHLLRMATAIHDGSALETGTSLAYCFQTLSPKLAPKDEVTTLVAVLNHREALLRRYAITRLAELADPTAASALEGRLATEGPELRPLVELALQQVRRDVQHRGGGEVERAQLGVEALATKLAARWRALLPWQQALAGGTPLLVVALGWALARGARRRRQQEHAFEVAQLVQPSDEFLAEAAAEAEAAQWIDEQAPVDDGALAADQQGAAGPSEDELLFGDHQAAADPAGDWSVDEEAAGENWQPEQAFGEQGFEAEPTDEHAVESDAEWRR
jgi:hypothetical protein